MDRKIDKPELDLNGLIYGQSPVQGEGTIQGHPFYFRARHDEWTFSISENTEIDPVDIQTTEAGHKFGFYRKKQYGLEGEESASYMDLETAEKLIIDCTMEYKNIG